MESDTAEAPLEVTGFSYEVEAAYIQDFAALGARAQVRLFDKFSIGVKLSIDPRDGAIFTIPFFGVT